MPCKQPDLPDSTVDLPVSLDTLPPHTAAVFAKIMRMLAGGYTGDITLHCKAGSIASVGVDHNVPARIFAEAD